MSRQFAGHPHRATTGRFVQEASKGVAAQLEAIVSASLNLEGRIDDRTDRQLPPEVHNALACVTAALRNDLVGAGVEVMCMPSVRLHISVVREVYMAPASKVFDFLQAKDPKRGLGLKDISRWLTSATKEEAHDFVSKMGPSALTHVSCGPGDVLVLPPAWLFAERTMPDADVFAVKRQFICDKFEEGLSALCDRFNKTGKLAQHLQTLVHWRVLISGD